MAMDWCRSHTSMNVELKLFSDRTNALQYNGLTVAEVASLIINDFGDGIPTRDIIVNKQDSGPKRISELHPSYMSLQYPLLFPYGKNSFHDSIPYYSNSGARKTNRGYMTMKEYHSYTIHHHKDQGTTIDTLRMDLYHNVCDAVTRGDTNAAGLGKRIVLPGTITGGPRYMMQNYQDAMAICRTYGNPDMFVTFTSNLKWQEISDMLAYIPRQKPHDRPEVGTRVFKLKLTELLDDLQKKQIFGACLEVVCVIECQKRGLSHAHILLWLEEACKCKTAAKIDDIISAELLFLTNDPEGYKVVTEYMLHRPCKTEGKYAPCTIEGKCTKRYPKAFYAKTILDDDGHDEVKFPPATTKPNYIARFKKLTSLATKGRPLKLWEATWELLSEDILFKKRKLFKYPELQLTQEQIQNYCLIEIQELLNRSGRSLSDFQELPRPNPKLLTNMDNRLIREALDFDMNKSKIEHQQLNPL
nr:helicase [Tanacetum cinerariifolium]